MTKQKRSHKKEMKSNELEDLKLRYKRVLADYQNLTKRCEEEKMKIIELANKMLIEKLLAVLQDLEASQKHSNDEGISKITRKLKDILSEEGLEEICPENETFDPRTCEALETGDGEKDMVIKVHQKGYKLKNKVIRPAMVVVGNGNIKKV